jgi:hypothetical protein
MSLVDDIKKIMEMVTSETQKFVTKANGGVKPTADEIMEHAESFEFPELTTSDTSYSFFVWKKTTVMRLAMTVHPTGGTTVTSKELPEDQWPKVLKLRLAQSVELRNPDGTTHKIR